MDRCRCEEYAAAVEKLRFYTVGTLRPDIIENYNRSGFLVRWIKHAVDYADLKFTKPRAIKKQPQRFSGNVPSPINVNIKQMWCPYMTPVKK